MPAGSYHDDSPSGTKKLMRRPLSACSILLSFALVVAACGAGSDAGSDTIVPSAPATTVVSTTASVPAGTDPCAGTACARTALLGELISAIPDAGLHRRVTTAFAALNDAAANCGSLAAWTQDLELAVERFETLIGRFQSSPVLEEWRGSDAARALSDELRDRMVLQDRCLDGAATAGEKDVRKATEVTARAVAINDWYHIRLYDEAPSQGAETWYHSTQLGQLLELERLTGAEGSIEVLVVGPSTVMYGVDAQALADTTGRNVMNIGVVGLFTEVAMPWIRSARRRGRGVDTVVLGVAASEAFRLCGRGRGDDMRQFAGLRSFSFAARPVLAGLDPEQRLVGPGGSYYADNPVRRSALATLAEAGRGNARNSPDVDPSRLAADRDLYGRLLEAPTRCDSMVTSLGVVVDDLVASGLRVLVVNMPLHPEVIALHPDGASAFAAVVTEQRELALDAGAEYLDLTTLLAGDAFIDLTDPNSTGRDRITAEIADALG